MLLDLPQRFIVEQNDRKVKIFADGGEQFILRGAIEVAGRQRDAGRDGGGHIVELGRAGAFGHPVYAAAVSTGFSAALTFCGTSRSEPSASLTPESPASWYSASSLTLQMS